MKPIEIIVIICCVLIVGGVFARYVYRKVTKKPSYECQCCSKKMINAIKNIKID